jgi:hypothetical protein
MELTSYGGDLNLLGVYKKWGVVKHMVPIYDKVK